MLKAIKIFYFYFYIYLLLITRKPQRHRSLKARLQPFTVLFSFSAILVYFIDAQIHSCFRENMSGFEGQ